MASVTAVIVTFNPPAGFADRIRAVAAEAEHIVIVDNASNAGAKSEIANAVQPFGQKISCILNDANRGLAAALNQGINSALSSEAEWILLLDHDSMPEAGMVKRMLNAYAAYPDPGRIGLIAPEIVDRNTVVPTHYLVFKGRYLFNRMLLTQPVSDAVATVITSGSLVKADAFRKFGLMPEAFFIDYIDHAFCLRLRKNGMKILLVKGAILHHSLGAKTTHRLLGMTIVASHHSEMRCFYIFRNRIWVWRLYGRDFPAFICHDFLAACLGIFRIAMFEENRIGKLKAIARGIWRGCSIRPTDN